LLVSLNPVDVVNRLRERLSQRSPEDLSAEASAKALLPELTRALRSAGAKRIVLFGSLADGPFRIGSDIDLAVAGLTERTLAGLEHEFTILARRPVELANLDSAPESLRRSIDRFGVELT
jgi:predicted nucleotidyltransferase